MNSVSEGFFGAARVPQLSWNSNLPYASPLELLFTSHQGEHSGVHLVAQRKIYRASKEPLNRRGWVLQERLLSLRVLILPSFGGFSFQCDKHEQHDGRVFAYPSIKAPDSCGYRLPQHPGKSYHEYEARDAHKAWHDIFRDYAPRELSDPSDKLIAIFALAELFAARYSFQLGTYLYGHWTQFVHVDLNWYVHVPVAKCSSERAPSWSWASVDGAVYYSYELRNPLPPAISDFLKIQNHLLDPTAPERLVVEVMLVPIHLSPAQDRPSKLGCFLTQPPQGHLIWLGLPDCAEEIPVEWTEAYLVPLGRMKRMKRKAWW